MPRSKLLNKVEKIAELVIYDFNLEEDKSLITACDLEELRAKLEKIVAYLLDNDFQRLLNAMYRLDIDEEKFKMAISGLHEKVISKEIVELILSREMQKIDTRIKYGGY